jgi:hypothetical protein
MNEPVETLSGDPTLALPEFASPPAEPLPLLGRWLAAADERGIREPRALALATADAEGRPSNRIVLLKRATPAIVFAFGAGSRKGRELAANPRAAGTLYWRETLQQVVFEGPVERLSAEESDRLFAERPPEGRAAPRGLGRLPPRPRPGRVLARQPRPPPPPPALRQERRRLDPPAPAALARGSRGGRSGRR